MITKQIVDDLDALLSVVPPDIREVVVSDPNMHQLLEIVMDLGRVPTARFPDKEVVLSPREVSAEDIDYVVSRLGPFNKDNRAGIERTLHRISAIRNRQGKIVGLTLRVGRAVFGTIKIVDDLIATGKNILLLGRPGVGKTTMLREAARVLADDFKKRVVVVDTSNEIAGDGDIPHPAIGRARRMQVPEPALQHKVMIEAVENHMPQVIVVDEIGTELEAEAARTIAERGVQLIATAHGNELENLILNPTLCDLVGGIQPVTLSDEEARRRGTQKTVLERKAPPTFDIVVEIKEFDKVAVHTDLASTIDLLLRGKMVIPEIRYIKDGKLCKEKGFLQEIPVGEGELKETKIYPLGIGLKSLEEAIRRLNLPFRVVNNLDSADVLLTSKRFYKRQVEALKEAEALGVPVYVIRRSTISGIESSLRSLAGYACRVGEALREVEAAVDKINSGAPEVELSPQMAYIRKLQHQLASCYGLVSESQGEEPIRRVVLRKGWC